MRQEGGGVYNLPWFVHECYHRSDYPHHDRMRVLGVVASVFGVFDVVFTGSESLRSSFLVLGKPKGNEIDVSEPCRRCMPAGWLTRRRRLTIFHSMIEFASPTMNRNEPLTAAPEKWKRQ